MIFGCCAPLDDYSLVSSAGFDFIELKGIEVNSWNEEQYLKAVEMVHSGPLSCHAINGYCRNDNPLLGPDFDRKKAGMYAEKLASRAAGLGAAFIGVGAPFARSIPEGFPVEVARRQFAEAMEDLASECRKRGIRAGIEPLSRPMCNFILDLPSAAELARKIDKDSLGYMFDFYHSARMGEDPETLIDMIRGAMHIHISGLDERRRTYPNENETTVLEKWSNILKKAGYDRTLSLEIGHEHDLVSLTRCMRMLRSIF